jgi:transposase
MRLGWFRPVHCKPLPAQEVRALLTARKLLQSKNHDVEMSLRGFGLKVGPTTPRTFAGRIRELVAGHATLSTIAKALLAARDTLFGQWQQLEKRLRSLAREDGRVRRLMSAPGVGTIVALTYASAIDDPGRFRSSKTVGAHFGLTPKKYQSGETDITGCISKIGDSGVRTALYEAANVILTRPVKGSTLKSWGMRLAARAGMRKAKVALARKLAVVLHRMLADGTPSSPTMGRDRSPLTKRRLQVRAVRDTGRSEQGPGAGTMDQARPHVTPRRRTDDRALLDWPTCSSSDPIRWRPSADPGQKRDPGGRIVAQRD